MQTFRNFAWFTCVGGTVLLGCASSKTAGEGPEAAPADDPGSYPLEEPAAPIDESPNEPADDHAAESQEPHVTPGMSVLEATNAVPSTTQRLNIEQEALAEPLMDPKLYEPCALQARNHFKLRVAVWDGKAVGLDVTTNPADPKLEACLRQQISSVEWKDKAKSINTVEYSF